MAAFRVTLLVPVFTTNDIEPAVTIHVSDSHGLGRAKIKCVLPKRNGFVTGRSRPKVNILCCFSFTFPTKRYSAPFVSRNPVHSQSQDRCRNASAHSLQKSPSSPIHSWFHQRF